MKIEVNNITLNYEKMGTGFPLILLHGNGEDLHIFDALFPRLAKYFTVYLVDSRNHGSSTKTTDYSYETMMEDVAAFIKKLALENARLLGYSDGGIIGLMLAMKYPQLVTKMAVLGVNLQPSDFKPDAYQYIKQTYQQTEDPLFKLMLEQPQILLEDLKKILIPTLVVSASDDIFVPQLYTDIVATIPKAVPLIIEGHDHESYIVNNDLLAEDFINFFS